MKFRLWMHAGVGTLVDGVSGVVMLVGVLVIGGFIVRTLSPEERIRVLQAIVTVSLRIKDYGRQELVPFRQALRSRTSWPVATVALAALNVLIYLRLAFGAGSLSDATTLVAWGASLGARTTNGEWWRLITAMFVNAGFFAVLINTTALVQVGLMLERLVGPFAFATVYVTAAVFGGFVSLSIYPSAVSAGASAAVLGSYGLLAATVVCGWRHESEVTVPGLALLRLAPMTALFALYAVVDANVAAAAEFIGLGVGLVFGFVATRDVGEHVPAARRVTRMLAASAAIALVTAIPLRGIADFDPEIQRLVDIERRAASLHQAALDRLKTGKITDTQVADLIGGTIVPEFEAADQRLQSFRGLTHEDSSRMTDAREYVRLRTDSWRLRAQSWRELGLSPGDGNAAISRARLEARHKSTSRMMGKAEGAERASLQVLDRLTRPAESHP